MMLQESAIAMKPARRGPARLLGGVLSLPYLLLRSSTAGAAVIAGLVQTFVFARVLSPEIFSIFILVGAFGVSLWVCDLGAAKILFVRQRARHIAQRKDGPEPAQANAIVMLYTLMVALGTLLCFAVMALRPSVTPWQATEFALFFSFSALNLVWFPLRNVSMAIDEFMAFETLDAIRRGGHIALTLALLIGMPLAVFLLLGNLLWLVVLAACIARLVRHGALAPSAEHHWATLRSFWRSNRAELLRSANYAAGELTIYNFPYLVVPIAFGLGAPTIVLDTVFKVFRGATLIYAGGLDPLVPRQTRAFAEHDAAGLKKATWTAAVLCAVPTIALCAVLLFAGDRLFTLLLGHAATVPRAAVLILVVMLLANLAQNVASNLLLHTGFFRDIARIATMMVILMAAMTAAVALAGLDIVGFIGGYAAAYVAGAGLYIYALRKPFHLAATKVAPQ